MLLLPPANWGEPFNPTTPDAEMEMIPVPTPNGPLPSGAVALMPVLELSTQPLELVA